MDDYRSQKCSGCHHFIKQPNPQNLSQVQGECRLNLITQLVPVGPGQILSASAFANVHGDHDACSHWKKRDGEMPIMHHAGCPCDDCRKGKSLIVAP